MNQNQLQKARLTRWHQEGNALLTLDDAERWLADNPLCLYLPRWQHLPIPAPTFVEAVAGHPDPTPAPATVSAAAELVARLVASGGLIALNLFGATAGMVGEQYDFLATPEALPYLYALQPQRNPKKAPPTTGAGRVSPLAAESFAILTRDGAHTAAELREKLGREVTEAAALRALAELWHTLRVVPVPQDHGAPALWELLSMRNKRELTLGSTQSQTTALSVLVSFYLQSVIAATAEQIELFLSPLVSRSRVQDVVRGLTASRQLSTLSLDGAEHLFIEGTLPEFAEEEGDAAAADSQTGADLDAGLEENAPSFAEVEGVRPPRRAPRPAAPRFADRARGGFKSPRPGGFGRPQRGGAGAPFRRERPAAGGEGTGARNSDEFQRPARTFDRERTGERPPRREGGFRPRTEGSDGERKPFAKRPFTKDRPARPARPFDRERSGERPPRREGGFRPRTEGSDGERKPFAKRPFTKDRPARPARPFDRERSGERPPRREGGFRPRTEGSDGERKPFAKRSFTKDRPARPARPFDRERSGERPPRREGGFRPRTEGSDGERKPFAKRPFTKDRPARPARPFDRERTGERPPRREGSFRPRTEGSDGERKPFAKRPFTKDRPARPARPFDRERTGERPPRREGGFRPRTEGSDGERKPFAKRPFTKDRPARPARPFDRERTGERPPRREGSFRPRTEGAGGERKPFAKRPFTKDRPARPASGSREGRPGGSFDRKGPARPRFGGGNSSAKPFGKSGKSFGKPGGRPAAGKRFGSKPPGARPRREPGAGDEG